VIRAADLAIRGLGALVAVVAAVASALLTAFLTPLYLGTVRVPVSIVIAIVANYALVWFAYRATGQKLVALLPGLVWIAVIIVLSAKTTEGDIVLAANNWVVLVSIFAGVGAYAVAAYRLFVPPPPPLRPPPPVAPAVAGPPAPPPTGPPSAGPSGF
jgi:hypothetical protein